VNAANTPSATNHNPQQPHTHARASLFAATPGGGLATGSDCSTPLLTRTRARCPAMTYALRSGTRSRLTSIPSSSEATPGAISCLLSSVATFQSGLLAKCGIGVWGIRVVLKRRDEAVHRKRLGTPHTLSKTSSGTSTSRTLTCHQRQTWPHTSADDQGTASDPIVDVCC